LIYSAKDDLFRPPQAFTLADYVQARLAEFPLSTVNCRLSTVFLTPTYLKSEGRAVRQPEFHHVFKRVRDRLNALCTFYGPGPIDADFKGLGAAAERVRTLARSGQWVERSRRSSQTGQRHELSGFTGECTYEFPASSSEFLDANGELLQWLICGELLHVGRHTPWGNGWYVVECANPDIRSEATFEVVDQCLS
jgi:CRISPR/Cas system endoribonuclease Cas6 (RAMP superfamily)